MMFGPDYVEINYGGMKIVAKKCPNSAPYGTSEKACD
jgi:hypothetical protein